VIKTKRGIIVSEVYGLYIENPTCINRERERCGQITKQQAEDFLKKLAEYDMPPKSCCFGCISAKIITHETKHILIAEPEHYYQKLKNFEFNGQLLIDFDRVRCKCDSCIRNIKNGKCIDAFVRETLGKIIFKKNYQR
jgi:hypothetical protein